MNRTIYVKSTTIPAKKRTIRVNVTSIKMTWEEVSSNTGLLKARKAVRHG